MLALGAASSDAAVRIASQHLVGGMTPDMVRSAIVTPQERLDLEQGIWSPRSVHDAPAPRASSEPLVAGAAIVALLILGFAPRSRSSRSPLPDVVQLEGRNYSKAA